MAWPPQAALRTSPARRSAYPGEGLLHTDPHNSGVLLCAAGVRSPGPLLPPKEGVIWGPLSAQLGGRSAFWGPGSEEPVGLWVLPGLLICKLCPRALVPIPPPPQAVRCQAGHSPQGSGALGEAPARPLGLQVRRVPGAAGAALGGRSGPARTGCRAGKAADELGLEEPGRGGQVLNPRHPCGFRIRVVCTPEVSAHQGPLAEGEVDPSRLCGVLDPVLPSLGG